MRYQQLIYFILSKSMDTTRAIDTWMEAFKEAWLSKDIDGVFSLLADDVEYWETPFQAFAKHDAGLRDAWSGILPLSDMELDYEVYVSDSATGRHSVVWSFKHSGGESAGVYLVKLNEEGRCSYFCHCAVPKK